MGTLTSWMSVATPRLKMLTPNPAASLRRTAEGSRLTGALFTSLLKSTLRNACSFVLILSVIGARSARDTLIPVPELPEVETVANGVDARVRDQRIRSVWTSGKPQTFKSAESEIAETLTGAKIERVRRVGKTIVADIARRGAGPTQLLVHLGMTGRLLVSQKDVPLPPHTHLVAALADGRELRF